jgi:hypothetical protein
MFRSPIVGIFRAVFLRRIYYGDNQANDDMYLTAVGLTPGGNSTVHIYTQTEQGIQRTEHT